MKSSALATIRKWVRPIDGRASHLRSACEAFVPAVLLALQIAFFPLDHPYFPYAVGVLGVLAIGYAVYGLTYLKDSAQRWHLVPPWWADGDDYAYGVLFIVTLFLAGLG